VTAKVVDTIKLTRDQGWFWQFALLSAVEKAISIAFFIVVAL
jgi:hypothetical protein